MINLHAVVRRAITYVHDDEPMTIYHSVGQKSVRGKNTPIYAEGENVLGQPQSDNDEALIHERAINSNEIRQKIYLYSDPHQPTAGIVRIYARNGDIIKRSDGSYWLVTGVLDDFHRAGWVCVRATLQVIPPDFSASEWFNGGTDEQAV